MALLGAIHNAKPLGTFRLPRSDLDVDSLILHVPYGVGADVKRLTTSADLIATLEGAGTLTLKIRDYARSLLRSELANSRTRLIIDNIEYTLVKVGHDWDELTLIFEESTVNLLRRYDTPKKANRDNTTRAQFIRGMISEVRERRIPTAIPELNERQPIASG